MGTSSAYEEFNARVRQDSVVRGDTYLNAPLYYLLTGRKGAWVHEGYGAVLVVCKHPNVPDRLLVFPEIGAPDRKDKGRLTASILANLTPPSGGVQLARYNDDDMQAVRDALSCRNDRTPDSIEVMTEDVLDWRYPVHVLDTNRVALLHGGAFIKIRNKCHQVESRVDTIALDDPRALRTMRAALKYWEGSVMMREGTQDSDVSYYTTLFTMIETWPHLFGGHVYMEGKRPVGFTVHDKAFKGTANLLANLCDASITGMADYQVVHTCRALAASGVSGLNFGGSETASLDAFKRKFSPKESFNIASGAVNYAPRQDINIRSSVLVPELA